MDFPKHIDTIILDRDSPFCVLMGHRSTFLYCNVFMVFILANSADPDEMQPYTAFHLGFTVCESNCLPVSRTKKR